MFKYVSLITIVLFAALLFFITHSQSQPPEVDFTFAMVDSVKTIDPAIMSLHTEIEICQGLWEGLFSYNPKDSTPTDGVAYYPADITNNFKTWVFHLRPDAKWSNGDPVTANDFIYGWRRALEPGTASDYTYLIRDNIVGAAEYAQWRNNAVKTIGILLDLDRGKNIKPEDMLFLNNLKLPGLNDEKPNWKGIFQKFHDEHVSRIEEMFDKVDVRAIDDHTLKVELNKTLTYFEDLVPFCTYSPIHRESIEKLRITDDKVINDYTLWVFDPQWVKAEYHHNGYPGLVSNGPFKMAEWRFKDYMLFTKNEHYWDRDNVKIDTVMAKIVPESNACFMAYESGKIDYTSTLSTMSFVSSLIKGMKDGTRDDIHVCDAWGTYYFQVNCADKLNDGTDNPLKDKRIRMALNLAIDKQAIIDAVLKTGNTQANLMVPPGIIKGYNCPPGPAYNPDLARKLLADAGYPNGKGLMTIELYYSTNGTHQKNCEAISEMWKQELNINTSLRGAEWKIFDTDRQKKDFMICRAGWYGDYNDPTTFLDLLLSDNTQNFCSFANKQYDSFLQQAAACTDPQERLNLLAQAEKIVAHDEMPIIPIYYYVNIEAFRPEIKGLYMNANYKHPFKYIYKEK